MITDTKEARRLVRYIAALREAKPSHPYLGALHREARRRYRWLRHADMVLGITTNR